MRSRLEGMRLAIAGEEGIDIAAIDAFGRDVIAPILAQQRGQLLLVGLAGAERRDERLGGGFLAWDRPAAPAPAALPRQGKTSRASSSAFGIVFMACLLNDDARRRSVGVGWTVAVPG